MVGALLPSGCAIGGTAEKTGPFMGGTKVGVAKGICAVCCIGVFCRGAAKGMVKGAAGCEKGWEAENAGALAAGAKGAGCRAKGC